MMPIPPELLPLLLKGENAWVEWKENNADWERIGERLSALSNSALLAGQSYGYIVWGVADNGQITGTNIDPENSKKGNERIMAWMQNMLTPRVGLEWLTGEVEGDKIVVCKVEAAISQPTAFRGKRFVRIDTITKPLDQYPAQERELWKRLEATHWEAQATACGRNFKDTLDKIGIGEYYRLLNRPVPTLKAIEDDLLRAQVMLHVEGQWCLSNAGALALSVDLQQVEPKLARKQLRIRVFKQNSRLELRQSWDMPEGYFLGFQQAMAYILRHIPQEETYSLLGIRQDTTIVSPLAIREVVANALIHQDLTILGAGPIVNVFSDRIEVVSPGTPLIPADRMIDLPPKSRNPALATLARRLGIAEEEGKGIDRVISLNEEAGLPAPELRADPESFTVVLHYPRPFAQLSLNDKLRACYQHAALMYTQNRALTNQSLRARLRVSLKQSSTVSFVIKKAIEQQLIKPVDGKSTSRKFAEYIPYWASV